MSACTLPSPSATGWMVYRWISRQSTLRLEGMMGRDCGRVKVEVVGNNSDAHGKLGGETSAILGRLIDLDLNHRIPRSHAPSSGAGTGVGRWQVSRKMSGRRRW